MQTDPIIYYGKKKYESGFSCGKVASAASPQNRWSMTQQLGGWSTLASIPLLSHRPPRMHRFISLCWVVSFYPSLLINNKIVYCQLLHLEPIMIHNSVRTYFYIQIATWQLHAVAKVSLLLITATTSDESVCFQTAHTWSTGLHNRLHNHATFTEIGSNGVP